MFLRLKPDRWGNVVTINTEHIEYITVKVYNEVVVNFTKDFVIVKNEEDIKLLKESLESIWVDDNSPLNRLKEVKQVGSRFIETGKMKKIVDKEQLQEQLEYVRQANVR